MPPSRPATRNLVLFLHYPPLPVSSPTPIQKKAAKAFVKEVVALEKRCKLPRSEFAALVGVPSRTYLSWRNGVLPTGETQAKVRETALAKKSQLQEVASELFNFLFVTVPEA